MSGGRIYSIYLFVRNIKYSAMYSNILNGGIMERPCISFYVQWGISIFI